MRGVSILERLAGLCDGVLQSFTQKPQSPPHREMTVAGGTASAHDSPISAPPGLKNGRRTPLPGLRAGRARAACPAFVQHAGDPFQPDVIPHPPRAPHRTPLCASACTSGLHSLLSLLRTLLRTHRPAPFAGVASLPCFLALLPFPPFLPVRSTRTGKMRAFAARPGCQTVRARAADRSCDRALQLYRPSYPRYYNPPIAGQ